MHEHAVYFQNGHEALHTYAPCIAVPLVWGSLTLAPNYKIVIEES